MSITFGVSRWPKSRPSSEGVVADKMRFLGNKDPDQRRISLLLSNPVLLEAGLYPQAAIDLSTSSFYSPTGVTFLPHLLLTGLMFIVFFFFYNGPEHSRGH